MARTSVAKRANTTPSAINDVIAAQIANIQERVTQPTGSRITVTQSKTFKLPDGRESPGPLELVVVDFAYGNFFYEGAYDRNNITPPVCFALNFSDKQMVPSENSPKKQAGSCAACPQNQWGSDGKGKACGNAVLLAVLHPDDLEGALMVIKVSATGLKPWNGYVNSLATALKRPPWTVSTTVSFDPHSEYSSLRFSSPELLSEADMTTVYARAEEAKRILMVEPDLSGNAVDKPAKPASAKRRAARG